MIAVHQDRAVAVHHVQCVNVLLTCSNSITSAVLIHTEYSVVFDTVFEWTEDHGIRVQLKSLLRGGFCFMSLLDTWKLALWNALSKTHQFQLWHPIATLALRASRWLSKSFLTRTFFQLLRGRRALFPWGLPLPDSDSQPNKKGRKESFHKKFMKTVFVVFLLFRHPVFFYMQT